MFLSAILLYGVTFLLCILTLFKGPFIGLTWYFALSFWRPQDIYWYALQGSRLSFWIAFATFISAFLHKKRVGEGIKGINEFAKYFTLFFLFVLNSYIFSTNKEMSYPWFILFSKLMLMAILVVILVTEIRQLRVLIIMLVVAFGVLAVRANAQYFFEGVWQATSPGEPGLPGSLDNNGFAMGFVVVIPLAFFLFFNRRERWWIRWGAVALIPFMIHAIILTYSRGGFLGMIIVLGGCVLFLKRRLLAIFSGISLYLILMRLHGPSSRARMGTVFEYEIDPSVQSRFESWRAAREMMFDHPLAGVGIGNFEMNSQLYNPALNAPRAAHNAFFHFGGEIGLIAFLFYIVLLIIAFYSLMQIRRFYRSTCNDQPHFYYATALLISLVGFTVCSMFLSLNYLELYYFILALVGVLHNFYLREKNLEERSP